MLAMNRIEVPVDFFAKVFKAEEFEEDNLEDLPIYKQLEELRPDFE